MSVQFFKQLQIKNAFDYDIRALHFTSKWAPKAIIDYWQFILRIPSYGSNGWLKQWLL